MLAVTSAAGAFVVSDNMGILERKTGLGALEDYAAAISVHDCAGETESIRLNGQPWGTTPTFAVRLQHIQAR